MTTPKRTGRKDEKLNIQQHRHLIQIKKLKNLKKIISTINSILIELDKDKSKLHKTPEGMYT